MSDARLARIADDDDVDGFSTEAKGTGHPAEQGASFTAKPADMGLKTHIELDDIEGLLDRLEGVHRK